MVCCRFASGAAVSAERRRPPEPPSVTGNTVAALAKAVRTGDVARVSALLKIRPELVNMELAENDERSALHFAVLDRSSEMVRLLMRSGANAQKGIYPTGRRQPR
jgi:Ankyrin repeats (3 copies)